VPTPGPPRDPPRQISAVSAANGPLLGSISPTPAASSLARQPSLFTNPTAGSGGAPAPPLARQLSSTINAANAANATAGAGGAPAPPLARQPSSTINAANAAAGETTSFLQEQRRAPQQRKRFNASTFRKPPAGSGGAPAPSLARHSSFFTNAANAANVAADETTSFLQAQRQAPQQRRRVTASTFTKPPAGSGGAPAPPLARQLSSIINAANAANAAAGAGGAAASSLATTTTQPFSRPSHINAQRGARGAPPEGIKWTPGGIRYYFVELFNDPTNIEKVNSFIDVLQKLKANVSYHADDNDAKIIRDIAYLDTIIQWFTDSKPGIASINTMAATAKSQVVIRQVLDTLLDETMKTGFLKDVYNEYKTAEDEANATIIANANTNINLAAVDPRELDSIIAKILRKPLDKNVANEMPHPHPAGFNVLRVRNEYPYHARELKSALGKTLVRLQISEDSLPHKTQLTAMIAELKSIAPSEATLKAFVNKHVKFLVDTYIIRDYDWMRPIEINGGYRKTRRFVRRTGKSRKQKRKTSSKRY